MLYSLTELILSWFQLLKANVFQCNVCLQIFLVLNWIDCIMPSKQHFQTMRNVTEILAIFKQICKLYNLTFFHYIEKKFPSFKMLFMPIGLFNVYLHLILKGNKREYNFFYSFFEIDLKQRSCLIFDC